MNLKLRRWVPFLIEALPLLLVLQLAHGIFSQTAQTVEYHGDEGHYMLTGRYFDFFLLQHDLGREEWGDNFVTQTQPMLTRYIVGGWLWAHGQDPLGLPPRYENYDHSRSLVENRALGTVPDEPLLEQARRPFVLLAVGVIGLLYLLGRATLGVIAGLVSALLALSSPFNQELLVRATPEAPLMFFTLATLLVAVLGARRGAGGTLPRGWAIGLGLLAGLALQTKMTALLSLAGLTAWGGLQSWLAFWQRLEQSWTAALVGGWRSGRGWALALLVALATFTATNPHLYPNPLTRGLDLVLVASREVAEKRIVRDAAVDDPLVGLAVVAHGALVEGTVTGSLGFPLEAILAVVGALWLTIRTARSIRATGQAPPEALVLVISLTYFLGVGASLPVTWARYIVPPLVLGTVLSGLGVAATGALLSAVDDSHRRTQVGPARVRGAGPAPLSQST